MYVIEISSYKYSHYSVTLDFKRYYLLNYLLNDKNVNIEIYNNISGFIFIILCYKM